MTIYFHFILKVTSCSLSSLNVEEIMFKNKHTLIYKRKYHDHIFHNENNYFPIRLSPQSVHFMTKKVVLFPLAQFSLMSIFCKKKPNKIFLRRKNLTKPIYTTQQTQHSSKRIYTILIQHQLNTT